MSNNVLKYSVAIPVFAAIFLVAVTVFPLEEQQVPSLQQMSVLQQAQAAERGEVSYGKTSSEKQTIAIHIKSGDPDDKNELWSAKMGLMLAQHMNDEGREVLVLLDVQGVNLGVKSPEQSLSEHRKTVQELVDSGVRVVVCEPCLKEAGYDANELSPGIEINRPAKMSRILSGPVIVMDY